MKRILTAAAVSLGAMGTAQAVNLVTVTVDSGSLTDLRMIGGRVVVGITDYTQYGGSLDATDPNTWPYKPKSLATAPAPFTSQYLASTWAGNCYTNTPACGTSVMGANGQFGAYIVPVFDPNDPAQKVSASVGGSLVIDLDNLSASTGVQTGSTLTQLSAIQMGVGYQQDWVIADVIVGDTSKGCANSGAIFADPNAAPCATLTWTYNAGTNVLTHQQGGFTTTTGNRTALCLPIPANTSTSPQVTDPVNFPMPNGTSCPGSVSQLLGRINQNGGSFGNSGSQAHSPFNWTGVAANYSVQDNSTVPWNNASGVRNLTIAGGSGQAGVVWDWSQLYTTGTIYARVYSDSENAGSSAQGYTALYSLHVIPIPGAVWLLGSALGLLGWLRRRASV
jgi:hypothetical protein